MKTVGQIVKEYQNRQKMPEYSQITIHPEWGPQDRYLVFDDVTNFESVYKYGEGNCLEFDSVYQSVSRHIKIKGHVIQSNKTLPGTKCTEKIIAKFCKSVTVYTHSGKREIFPDVANLSENETNRKVEFYRVVDGVRIHVKMTGTIERYEEIINDTDD